MCEFLKVNRSLVYYHINNRLYLKKTKDKDIELVNLVKKIFKDSKNNFGTRKIKKELEKLGICVFRKIISKIMKLNGLVSNYTVAQYKVHKSVCNEAKIENIVDRDFDDRDSLEVIVSDLTYVRVGNSWNYVCLLEDLHNREIVGYSVGKKKDAGLVEKAIFSCKYPLDKMKIFHSDRGKEYDNIAIDEILEVFNIERSLSSKGNPYDNAVCEALNKVLKIEFIYQNKFENLEKLQMGLAEYVYWYNNVRIHGSLGYLTPMEYRKLNMEVGIAA